MSNPSNPGQPTPEESAHIRAITEGAYCNKADCRYHPGWLGGPGPAYVCYRCGRRSWNPNDAVNRYCGVCGFEDQSATIDRRPATDRYIELVDEPADDIHDRREALLHYLRWFWAIAVSEAGLTHPEVHGSLFQLEDRDQRDVEFLARFAHPDIRRWVRAIDRQLTRHIVGKFDREDDPPALILGQMLRERRPRWFGLKKAAAEIVRLVASDLPRRP